MKPEIPDLSIIIVHYNTLELTKLCLQSLAKSKTDRNTWEVLVVDNGSTDGSGERLQEFCSDMRYGSWVQVLMSPKNLGFSGGNNLAIKKSRGNNILLLNSDTEVTSDAIIRTLDLFHDPHVGAATCRLVLANGATDPACHRGFPTPWASISYFLGLERLFPKTTLFGGYHMGYKDAANIHEIDCPSGAFFLIRRSVIEQVGLLDEDYFMYGEDVDWAYRIKKAGWKIMFTPFSEVLHKKKQSGRNSKNAALSKQISIYFYETMKLFYKKHYETVYPWIVTRGVCTLIDIRIWIVQVLSI